MSLPKDNWKHRRRMAYGAWLMGIAVYPGMVYATDNPSLLNIAIPLYSFLTFVLTAYYTIATWDHTNERNGVKKDA